MAAAAVSVAAHVAQQHPVVPEDEEKFAEDECTMDFGDEDDVKPQPNGVSLSGPGRPLSVTSYTTLQQRHLFACQFPGGEDLSRYLPDDDDEENNNNNHDEQKMFPVPDYDEPQSPPARSQQRTAKVEQSTLHRYRKRSEQQQPLSPTSKALGRPRSISPPPRRDSSDGVARAESVEAERRRSSAFNLTPISTAAAPSTMPTDRVPPNDGDGGARLSRAKSISSIRERLSRFLTPRRNKSRTSSGATIHDFSFADSKMASEFLNHPASPSQLETHSDLGVSKTDHWWDSGTTRSARSAYSGGSSTTSKSDSTKSATRGNLKMRNSAVGEGSEKATTGKPLFRVFQRNRKSLSVPNLADTQGNGSSSASEMSSPPPPSSVNNSSTLSSPPPLPPLRPPGRARDVVRAAQADDEASRRRSRSATRFNDFWAKLKSSNTPSDDSKNASSGGNRESEKPVTRRQSEAVSTLRYKRTNDEIPVSF